MLNRLINKQNLIMNICQVQPLESLAIFDTFIQGPHMANKEKLEAVPLHFVFCMLKLR